jgi:apolipoprotein N-acyltransferase
MRAAETGRVMLRATNTGVTAVINANGFIDGQLPEFTGADLTMKVQGRSGSTPYVVVGNVAAILWAILLLGIATLRSSRQ